MKDRHAGSRGENKKRIDSREYRLVVFSLRAGKMDCRPPLFLDEYQESRSRR